MIHELFVATKTFLLLHTLSFVDVPLHPVVENALYEQREIVSEEHNSHIYLMGIMAESEDDFIALGKKRFLSMSETTSNGDRQAYKVLPESKWTQLNQDSNICLLKTQGDNYEREQVECFNRLYRSCEAQRDLLDTYGHSVRIFNKAINRKKAKSFTDKGLFDWQTIKFIRRVNALDNVRLSYSLNCIEKEKNVSSIKNDIVAKQLKLRNIYAQTDDMILKLGLLLVLHENYIWLAFESVRSSLSYGETKLFKHQSLNELSLRNPFNREIRSFINFSNEAKSQALLDSGYSATFIEMLYKENRTLNRILYSYVELIHNSELHPHEYADFRVDDKHFYGFRWWKLGNIVGETLSAVAAPRFLDTTLDYKSLDMFIQLSNLAINYREAISKGDLEGLPESARNPYDGTLPYFNTSSWLCFREPQKLRGLEYCINTSWN